MSFFKKIAARMPEEWQTELKRLHFGRQIRRGDFEATEPEYRMLHQLVKPGDWVIDIGANVGHYTKRLSDLVGVEGRVIAFEPVPVTFSILAANVRLFSCANVTLINAAASDHTDCVGISFPKFSTGLSNYYQAQLSGSCEAHSLTVLTLKIDSFSLDTRIALVKIDTEGHERFVLKGMWQLIERFHPTLIVETGSQEIIADLSEAGYVSDVLPNSPNILFRYKGVDKGG